MDRSVPQAKTRFRLVIDRFDVARALAREYLDEMRSDTKSAGQDREAQLTRFVLMLAEDLDGDASMKVATLLETNPTGRHLTPTSEETRYDDYTTRCFGFAAGVVGAAALWDRDLDDKVRALETAQIIGRTAVWLLGRTPLPDAGGLVASSHRNSEEDIDATCRLVGLWLSHLGLARSVPSSIGTILARGLDYFAMWACASVALRFYDDFKLTMDEALQVARQALDFKLALVAALVRVARADGRLHFEEEQMLRLVLDHLAVSEAEKRLCLEAAGPHGTGPSLDVLARVSIDAHRDYIMARAVELAFANRRESRSEKKAIREIASALGVPEEQVSRQEHYMVQLNKTLSG